MISDDVRSRLDGRDQHHSLAADAHAPGGLSISLGQCSDKGRKEANQDFHGALIPLPVERSLKGIAIAIADGISSSNVSHIAAETAIKSFLTDYYCTSESWTVKTSAYRVVAAVNSWLHAQNRRGAHPYDRDKGYVCTFSALVIKSKTAHIFHVGDARIFRLNGSALEQLTRDHRVTLSSEQSYLGRALGVNQHIEIDYRAVPVSTGDVFILATDGVYEHVEPEVAITAIRDNADDLDRAASIIVDAAFRNQSPDNLTIQIVRLDHVSDGEVTEVLEQADELPPAPLLDAHTEFEGYRVLRVIHSSSRSHIYLAENMESGAKVVIKVPSIDLREDAAYLKRFMMEEWVARRIHNAHVLRPAGQARKRGSLYSVMEFVDGQTLKQWIVDNPKPDLEVVRGIVEQIAKGLRAFHRMEMLHQDLRPDNVMIDPAGTVRIIDFGSVKIPGVMEAFPSADNGDMMGTAPYTAPEYIVGDAGTSRSDLYALGVITYQMLTGKLPYGARMARARTRSQQARVTYTPATVFRNDVPSWIDGALRKAVHPDPLKRQEALSEFTHDLRYPRSTLLSRRSVPLIERNPVLFWKIVSAVLVVIIIVLTAWR